MLNSKSKSHFPAFISEIHFYILNFILFSFILYTTSKKILVGHEKWGVRRMLPHGSVGVFFGLTSRQSLWIYAWHEKRVE